MARCAGFKPSGEQCERIVRAPQTYCFAHDPSRSQERTRNASKAGKSRPSSEIRSVKNQLQDLTNRLLSGEVERADAAVCGQLLNVKLRALEQERRWLGDRRAGGAPRGCRGRPEGTREEDFGLMKKGLGKLYDRFTPEERFRLDLEAMSRGDEEESRRLVDSCPRKSYTMSDIAFTDRWLASEVITLSVCIDLAQHLSKLRIVIAFRDALPSTYNACEKQAILAYLDGYEAGARRAWEEAGMKGDPPRWRNGDEEEEDPALEKALEAISDRIQGMSARFMGLLEADLERHFAEEAKTIWEAFGLFCREELEVEPEKLAAVWMGPALDEIKEHEETLESAEADAERVEEYRQALLGAWKKLVRSS